MLRITRTNPGETPAVLKLEGRLAGPWVDELERAIALSSVPGLRVVLLMEHVSYADEQGVALIRRLAERMVDVGTVSAFVGVVLERRSDECA